MPLIVQRRPRVVGVAGRLGGLDVLERAEHVEQAHRDDDREVGHEVPAAERGEEVAEDRHRQVQRGGLGPRADRREPGHPGEERADRDRDDAARKMALEAHAAEVGQHDDRRASSGRRPDGRRCGRGSRAR